MKPSLQRRSCLTVTSDRYLPDKAIDLVDEAGSRVRLIQLQLPPQPAKRVR